MKLWLARHARLLVEEGVCYGASDIEADAHATRAAAAALAAVLPHGVPVRASPLRRCTALAAALQGLRDDLVWQPDARLAEMDFGCWEGRRWDEIEKAEFDRWDADFAHFRFGGRESVREFMSRVEAARRDTFTSADEAVWITHAGVMRAVDLLTRKVFPTRADQWRAAAPPVGGHRLLHF